MCACTHTKIGMHASSRAHYTNLKITHFFKNATFSRNSITKSARARTWGVARKKFLRKLSILRMHSMRAKSYLLTPNRKKVRRGGSYPTRFGTAFVFADAGYINPPRHSRFWFFSLFSFCPENLREFFPPEFCKGEFPTGKNLISKT